MSEETVIDAAGDTVVKEPVVETPAGTQTHEGSQEPIVQTPTKWYDGLNDDLKAHPSVTKYNSLEDAVNGSISLEKMVGKDKAVIPTEKSTPEEWSEFYGKVGRPTDINGYETPKLEVQDNLKMKDAHLELFKQKAHELGLNNKQFQELYGLQTTVNQDTFNVAMQQSVEAKKASETALRTEWGDAYAAKVDGAQNVINAYFKGRIDDSNKSAFDALANSKGFIEAMSEIASKVGEDGIGGSARATKTPQEAQTEFNEIIMNDKHPYHDNTHPEHQASVDKVLALQQMANPTAA